MDSEILVLKKDDLVEILEQFSQKIASKIPNRKQTKSEDAENPRVKRLNTRQIKDMLGIGDTTFDSIHSKLPMHRTKTGRMFAYEHDIIIFLFREHPPYFDYTRFYEYISEENLIKHICK